MINTSGYQFQRSGGADLSGIRAIGAAAERPVSFVDGRTLAPDDAKGIENLAQGVESMGKSIAGGITVAATGFAEGVNKRQQNIADEKKQAREDADSQRKYAIEEARLGLKDQHLATAEAAKAEHQGLVDQKTQLEIDNLRDKTSKPAAWNRVFNKEIAGSEPPLPVPDPPGPLTGQTLPPVGIPGDPQAAPDVVPVGSAPEGRFGVGAGTTGNFSLGIGPQALADKRAPGAMIPAPQVVQPQAQAPAPGLPVGGQAFSVAGDTKQYWVHLVDGTIQGPYPIKDEAGRNNDSSTVAAPPPGMEVKSITRNSKGEATTTFEPSETKEQKAWRMAERHNTGVRQEQKTFYSRPAVAAFERPQGVRQAIPSFFSDFDDLNATPGKAPGIHDVGLLDMFARAESGGRVTEAQLAFIHNDAIPFKDKLAIWWHKPLQGDVLTPDIRNVMARVITHNHNGGAALANQAVETERKKLIKMGITDEDALPKPYVLLKTQDDIENEIKAMGPEAIKLSRQLDGLKAEKKDKEAAAVEAKIEELKAKAQALDEKRKSTKSFIVNMDEWLNTEQGFGGGGAVPTDATTGGTAPAQMQTY